MSETQHLELGLKAARVLLDAVRFRMEHARPGQGLDVVYLVAVREELEDIVRALEKGGMNA